MRGYDDDLMNTMILLRAAQRNTGVLYNLGDCGRSDIASRKAIVLSDAARA